MVWKAAKPAESYEDADADGEKTHRATRALIRSRIRLADRPQIQRQECGNKDGLSTSERLAILLYA